ncbi:hypothetical protein [Pontibacter cellulosilyticus]|nr:hypothetical protein [Pontibacter cellulosilyticus]
MITLKTPVARKQQGFYTFSADAVLILYFCRLWSYNQKYIKVSFKQHTVGQMKSVKDAILEGIGKQYLYLRLRQEERVKRELNTKYEGQYRNAGLVLLFDVFMALAVVVAVALLAGVLYLLAA